MTSASACAAAACLIITGKSTHFQAIVQADDLPAAMPFGA